MDLVLITVLFPWGGMGATAPFEGVEGICGGNPDFIWTVIALQLLFFSAK